MATKSFKIRPYARLLTMLGEQLIKNEQIALAELIKNAYDADANWVKISFIDFQQDEKSEEIKSLPESKIIIEDDGCGMTLPIIAKSWMNPASPYKKTKENEDIKKTPRGRIIQGEKGIGRFAILKLGRIITIITRPENTDIEYVIKYDFSQYDDDFLTENGVEKELFIDDINIDVIERKPITIISRKVIVNNCNFEENIHGTRIEITNLKGSWNSAKVKTVSKESQKLESIFDKIFDKNKANQFQIGFEINSKRLFISDEIIKKLSNLLEQSAVLKITNGLYDEGKQL